MFDMLLEMHINHSAAMFLDGVTIALSLTLRYRAIKFVRWMPWGDLLLEQIGLLWTLFLAVWLLQCLLGGTFRRKQQVGLNTGNGKPSGWLALSSVILGRCESKSKAGALALLLVNSCFAMMPIDFVYRARVLHGSNDLVFSRMGFVNDSSATIVARMPAPCNIQIQYRVDDGNQTYQWLTGDSGAALAANDYVVTFTLTELQPDTRYSYRTNASHTGAFTTTPSHPKRWSMISTSCIKPFFPYSPFDHSLNIKGFRHLTRYIHNSLDRTDFMLFLGDFIYIDLPKRFGYGTEHYQEAYRQVYASPDWSQDLKSLSWIHAYDDHEITNNWDQKETGIYPQAIKPFTSYQHGGNPEPVREGATYYAFTHGDVSFFVMDTRRYRSPGHAQDGENKTMLGHEQFQDIKDWLQSAPGWKVVATSVPFTKVFDPTSADSWAGYLWEREQLLHLMWDNGGALIISGDMHQHATVAFPQAGTNDHSVIEFSTSPLNMFYDMEGHHDRSQLVDTDVMLNYLAVGKSKFGSFTFDTSRSDVWKMDFELIVDGETAWNYTVRQPRTEK